MTVATIAVIPVGGIAFLKRCLERLLAQTPGKPVEVLAPVDSTLGSVEDLREQFPDVCFLDLGVLNTVAECGTVLQQHELFERRISAVLAVARGQWIALLQDWGMPAADWCDRFLEACALPHAAVGGAIENEGQGILNWAAYFQDFGRYELPLLEGPAICLSDVNIAYRRAALDSVKHLWERRYNEVIVNWDLLRRGEILWRNPRMVVHQDRGRLAFCPLIRERFLWGRLFGSARAFELGAVRLLPYVVFSPLIPLVIIARAAGKVLSGRRNRLMFLRAFPVFVVLVIVWVAGELCGYITRTPSPIGEAAE